MTACALYLGYLISQHFHAIHLMQAWQQMAWNAPTKSHPVFSFIIAKITIFAFSNVVDFRRFH